MVRPGIEVNVSATRGARRGSPSDTAPLFIAGPTNAGTGGTVYRLDNIADWATQGLGARSGGAAVTYDSVETAFMTGVPTVFVSPIRSSDTAHDTVAEALAAIGPEYGPGQVSAPGDTAAYATLQAHAAANNRFALLDASADALVIPPLAGSGSNRNVPASPAIAGLLARSDLVRSTNQAPAGDLGYLPFVLDVDSTPDVAAAVTAFTAVRGSNADYSAAFIGGRFTDAQRATLDAAGINPVRVGPGGVQLYGITGLSSDDTFQFFGNSRFRMYLKYRLALVAEQFLFRQIDGQGRLLAEFAGALNGVLQTEYARGAIFGDTPEDAYLVDTSSNTSDTLADGQLKAACSYVPSPGVEAVTIDLVQATVAAGL